MEEADESVGYDMEFVPPLESKYECPICLMALREPTQTQCGHRFCRSCICQSMRETGSKCPIDNTPLSFSSLFPDNFAKREILGLRVKCPNPGCTFVFELRNLEEHNLKCDFYQEQCGLNCGLLIHRKSMEIHQKNECAKRLVSCEYCFIRIAFDEQENHLKECLKFPVVCQYCQMQLTREELAGHIEKDCFEVIVSCSYANMGCKEKMTRRDMLMHEKNSLVIHLQYVASTLNEMRIKSKRQLEKPETETFYHSWHTDGCKTDNEEGVTYSTSFSDPPSFTNKEPSGAYALEHSAFDFAIPDREPMRKFLPKTFNSNRSRQFSPATSHRSARHHDDIQSQYSTQTMSHMDLSILAERMRYQEGHIATQEQKILELQAKLESRDKEVKELTQKISRWEAIVMSNGIYYWKFENYTELQTITRSGETSVVHSPGFYTGYYGYKLCLRVNLNGIDSAHSSHVSLFVHFMQGEWDDFLDWPFSGKITLTILDQNEDTRVRNHISETLIAKPALAAFHRPKTNRNHKGFGYMEFAPLRTIHAGHYIKENCLLIKAVVHSN
ncbi:TNF receptor-associated factor 6-like [Saccoglossus kowalevskii]|uniref:RING-type E3 ubiquitin transferase n=1 Tax=Saccoglossus kowalevskii TaxID=10224 RepID=A0ABM0M7Q7_SACKO|nr:PREDICTED: TNF receptor-associated factor 6-like [Saccoglossus kowalevskii]